MINKKIGVLAIVSIFFALNLAFMSAEIKIDKEIVSSIAIEDTNTPAIFKLFITNLGNTDNFLIYSLSGIDIIPNESIQILSGETKEVLVQAYPKVPLKISPDYFSFSYNIKGLSIEESDELVITYVALKDAFDFSVEDINPASKTAKISITNKAGAPLDKVKLELSSLFFTDSRELSFNSFEKKVFEVSINEDKMRALLAGTYIINGKLTIGGAEASITAVMNFNEQEGIKTYESSTGSLLQKREINKVNEGNTKENVIIIIKKNLISSLFTSFNIQPTKKEWIGFSIVSTFRKEIAPNQNLDVIAKTNWWILILVIILLVIIYELADRYIKNKLVLKKRVSLVRTKGGEFALKVSIHLKARDFVEKIRIFDRLPPMVKVFEKYGAINPDKIDPINRRLEWNIQALGKGEERTLNYIIYSKIGVIGRFELPSVESIYEFNGKIKEAQSNRAFFVNEPSTKKE